MKTSFENLAEAVEEKGQAEVRDIDFIQVLELPEIFITIGHKKFESEYLVNAFDKSTMEMNAVLTATNDYDEALEAFLNFLHLCLIKTE